MQGNTVELALDIFARDLSYAFNEVLPEGVSVVPEGSNLEVHLSGMRAAVIAIQHLERVNVDLEANVEQIVSSIQDIASEELGLPWPVSTDRPTSMAAPEVRIAGKCIEIGFSIEGRKMLMLRPVRMTQST